VQRVDDDLIRMLAPVSGGDYVPYAGIGSRKTPASMCDILKKIGCALATRGLTLRSGAAPGADDAFEAGALAAGGSMEIYLPRAGYRDSLSDLHPETLGEAAWYKAQRIAQRYHGDWSRVRSDHARALLTRDTFQVLGRDLQTPSRLVIAWTDDGLASGGTGQAIRIAEAHSIPVLNLHGPAVLADVLAALDLG
jgi:hypothetical protein